LSGLSGGFKECFPFGVQLLALFRGQVGIPIRIPAIAIAVLLSVSPTPLAILTIPFACNGAASHGNHGDGGHTCDNGSGFTGFHGELLSLVI
jgi:hypothetical protein